MKYISLDLKLKFKTFESCRNWYSHSHFLHGFLLLFLFSLRKISQTFRDIAKEGYRSALTNKNERRRRAKASKDGGGGDHVDPGIGDDKSKKGPPKKRAVRTPGKSPESTSKAAKKEQLAKQIEQLKKEMEMLDEADQDEDETEGKSNDNIVPGDDDAIETQSGVKNEISKTKEVADQTADGAEGQKRANSEIDNNDEGAVEPGDTNASTRRSKRNKSDEMFVQATI